MSLKNSPLTQKHFISAGVALVLIWVLWLSDLHPHFSAISTNNDQPSGESWLPSWHKSSAGNGKSKSRPLVLFAFFETPLARRNMEFFLKHGLHDAADFLFVINGDTNVTSIIPDRPNISYVRRENECYDLGAFAEVLTKDDLYKRYDRFITMNASLRGPFFPDWSNACWSDMFLDRVTDKVKLVGMTLGCRPHAHVQSMIWATDRIGMETLLFPSEELISKFKAEVPPHDDQSPVPFFETPGINFCPKSYWKAVAVEVYATPLLRSAGYEIDVLMSAYRGINEYEKACKTFSDGDMLSKGHYWGMDLHPFDTIFAKTNRENNPWTLNKMTEWANFKNYSSYDHCHL